MNLSLIIALGALSLYGAHTQPGPEPAPGTRTSTAPKPLPMQQNTAPTLAATARSEKATYKSGETVKLFISLQNTGDKAVTVTFSSGQSFDFSAYAPGKTDPAWTWSMDKMFLMAIRNVKLEAGQKLDFDAEWTGAPAGRYRIESQITTNNGIKAKPFEIEVK